MRQSIIAKFREHLVNAVLSLFGWWTNLDFIKITALVTLTCFLISSVTGQAISAVLEKAREDKQFSQVLDGLAIPSSAGKITEARYFGSDQIVINIQDLHCHSEVQRNISNILTVLDEKYKLDTVYLEGAFGEVDTSWLVSIQDKSIRNKIVDFLIGQGKLTGAEHYSIAKEKPRIIRGLENRKLYEENYKRLSNILESQQTISSILSDLEYYVYILKEDYYNSKQRKLGSLISRHRSGTLGARKYYSILKKYAEKCGLDYYCYRNIVNYNGLLETERQLDYKRIAIQLQQFVTALKNKLPFTVYQSLLDKTGNFKNIDNLYPYLIRISKEYKIGLSNNYPELDKFFNYISLNNKINPMELIKEEERFTGALRIQLAESESQKEVAFAIDFFRYFGDYFGNKISAEDYEYFNENLEKFRVIWKKYVNNDRISMLNPYLSLFNDFYRANLLRNECFIREILKDGKGSKMAVNDASLYLNDAEKVLNSVQNGGKAKVIITGGFHTDGISKLLKKREISYIVITPTITQESKLSAEIYEKLAKEQSKILFQTFALLAISLGTTEIKAKAILEPLIYEALAKGKTHIEAVQEAFFRATEKKYSFGIDKYNENGIPEEFFVKDIKKNNKVWKAFVDQETKKLKIVEAEKEARSIDRRSRKFMARFSATFTSVLAFVIGKAYFAAPQAVVLAGATLGIFISSIGLIFLGVFATRNYLSQNKAFKYALKKVKEIYGGDFSKIDKNEAQRVVENIGKDNIIRSMLEIKSNGKNKSYSITKVKLVYDPYLNGTDTLFKYVAREDTINVNLPLLIELNDRNKKIIRMGIRHELGHRRILKNKILGKITQKLPVIGKPAEEFFVSLGDMLDYWPIATEDKAFLRKEIFVSEKGIGKKVSTPLVDSLKGSAEAVKELLTISGHESKAHKKVKQVITERREMLEVISKDGEDTSKEVSNLDLFEKEFDEYCKNKERKGIYYELVSSLFREASVAEIDDIMYQLMLGLERETVEKADDLEGEGVDLINNLNEMAEKTKARIYQAKPVTESLRLPTGNKEKVRQKWFKIIDKYLDLFRETPAPNEQMRSVAIGAQFLLQDLALGAHDNNGSLIGQLVFYEDKVNEIFDLAGFDRKKAGMEANMAVINDKFMDLLDLLKDNVSEEFSMLDLKDGINYLKDFAAGSKVAVKKEPKMSLSNRIVLLTVSSLAASLPLLFVGVISVFAVSLTGMMGLFLFYFISGLGLLISGFIGIKGIKGIKVLGDQMALIIKAQKIRENRNRLFKEKVMEKDITGIKLKALEIKILKMQNNGGVTSEQSAKIKRSADSLMSEINSTIGKMNAGDSDKLKILEGRKALLEKMLNYDIEYENILNSLPLALKQYMKNNKISIIAAADLENGVFGKYNGNKLYIDIYALENTEFANMLISHELEHAKYDQLKSGKAKVSGIMQEFVLFVNSKYKKALANLSDKKQPKTKDIVKKEENFIKTNLFQNNLKKVFGSFMILFGASSLLSAEAVLFMLLTIAVVVIIGIMKDSKENVSRTFTERRNMLRSIPKDIINNMNGIIKKYLNNNFEKAFEMLMKESDKTALSEADDTTLQYELIWNLIFEYLFQEDKIKEGELENILKNMKIKTENEKLKKRYIARLANYLTTNGYKELIDENTTFEEAKKRVKDIFKKSKELLEKLGYDKSEYYQSLLRALFNYIRNPQKGIAHEVYTEIISEALKEGIKSGSEEALYENMTSFAYYSNMLRDSTVPYAQKMVTDLKKYILILFEENLSSEQELYELQIKLLFMAYSNDLHEGASKALEKSVYLAEIMPLGKQEKREVLLDIFKAVYNKLDEAEKNKFLLEFKEFLGKTNTTSEEKKYIENSMYETLFSSYIRDISDKAQIHTAFKKLIETLAAMSYCDTSTKSSLLLNTAVIAYSFDYSKDNNIGNVIVDIWNEGMSNLKEHMSINEIKMSQDKLLIEIFKTESGSKKAALNKLFEARNALLKESSQKENADNFINAVLMAYFQQIETSDKAEVLKAASEMLNEKNNLKNAKEEITKSISEGICKSHMNVQGDVDNTSLLFEEMLSAAEILSDDEAAKAHMKIFIESVMYMYSISENENYRARIMAKAKIILELEDKYLNSKNDIKINILSEIYKYTSRKQTIKDAFEIVLRDAKILYGANETEMVNAFGNAVAGIYSSIDKSKNVERKEVLDLANIALFDHIYKNNMNEIRSKILAEVLRKDLSMAKNADLSDESIIAAVEAIKSILEYVKDKTIREEILAESMAELYLTLENIDEKKRVFSFVRLIIATAGNKADIIENNILLKVYEKKITGKKDILDTKAFSEAVAAAEKVFPNSRVFIRENALYRILINVCGGYSKEDFIRKVKNALNLLSENEVINAEERVALTGMIGKNIYEIEIKAQGMGFSGAMENAFDIVVTLVAAGEEDQRMVILADIISNICILSAKAQKNELMNASNNLISKYFPEKRNKVYEMLLRAIFNKSINVLGWEVPDAFREISYAAKSLIGDGTVLKSEAMAFSSVYFNQEKAEIKADVLTAAEMLLEETESISGNKNIGELFAIELFKELYEKGKNAKEADRVFKEILPVAYELADADEDKMKDKIFTDIAVNVYLAKEYHKEKDLMLNSVRKIIKDYPETRQQDIEHFILEEIYKNYFQRESQNVEGMVNAVIETLKATEILMGNRNDENKVKCFAETIFAAFYTIDNIEIQDRLLTASRMAIYCVSDKDYLYKAVAYAIARINNAKGISEAERVFKMILENAFKTESARNESEEIKTASAVISKIYYYAEGINEKTLIIELAKKYLKIDVSANYARGIIRRFLSSLYRYQRTNDKLNITDTLKNLIALSEELSNVLEENDATRVYSEAILGAYFAINEDETGKIAILESAKKIISENRGGDINDISRRIYNGIQRVLYVSGENTIEAMKESVLGAVEAAKILIEDAADTFLIKAFGEAIYGIWRYYPKRGENEDLIKAIKLILEQNPTIKNEICNYMLRQCLIENPINKQKDIAEMIYVIQTTALFAQEILSLDEPRAYILTIYEAYSQASDEFYKEQILIAAGTLLESNGIKKYAPEIRKGLVEIILKNDLDIAHNYNDTNEALKNILKVNKQLIQKDYERREIFIKTIAKAYIAADSEELKMNIMQACAENIILEHYSGQNENPERQLLGEIYHLLLSESKNMVVALDKTFQASRALLNTSNKITLENETYIETFMGIYLSLSSGEEKKDFMRCARAYTENMPDNRIKNITEEVMSEIFIHYYLLAKKYGKDDDSYKERIASAIISAKRAARDLWPDGDLSDTYSWLIASAYSYASSEDKDDILSLSFKSVKNGPENIYGANIKRKTLSYIYEMNIGNEDDEDIIEMMRTILDIAHNITDDDNEEIALAANALSNIYFKLKGNEDMVLSAAGIALSENKLGISIADNVISTIVKINMARIQEENAVILSGRLSRHALILIDAMNLNEKESIDLVLSIFNRIIKDSSPMLESKEYVNVLGGYFSSIFEALLEKMPRRQEVDRATQIIISNLKSLNMTELAGDKGIKPLINLVAIIDGRIESYKISQKSSEKEKNISISNRLGMSGMFLGLAGMVSFYILKVVTDLMLLPLMFYGAWIFGIMFSFIYIMQLLAIIYGSIGFEDENLSIPVGKSLNNRESLIMDAKRKQAQKDVDNIVLSLSDNTLAELLKKDERITFTFDPNPKKYRLFYCKNHTIYFNVHSAKRIFKSKFWKKYGEASLLHEAAHDELQDDGEFAVSLTDIDTGYTTLWRYQKFKGMQEKLKNIFDGAKNKREEKEILSKFIKKILKNKLKLKDFLPAIEDVLNNGKNCDPQNYQQINKIIESISFIKHEQIFAVRDLVKLIAQTNSLNKEKAIFSIVYALNPLGREKGIKILVQQLLFEAELNKYENGKLVYLEAAFAALSKLPVKDINELLPEILSSSYNDIDQATSIRITELFLEYMVSLDIAKMNSSESEKLFSIFNDNMRNLEELILKRTQVDKIKISQIFSNIKEILEANHKLSEALKVANYISAEMNAEMSVIQDKYSKVSINSEDIPNDLAMMYVSALKMKDKLSSADKKTYSNISIKMAEEWRNSKMGISDTGLEKKSTQNKTVKITEIKSSKYMAKNSSMFGIIPVGLILFLPGIVLLIQNPIVILIIIGFAIGGALGAFNSKNTRKRVKKDTETEKAKINILTNSLNDKTIRIKEYIKLNIEKMPVTNIGIARMQIEEKAYEFTASIGATLFDLEKALKEVISELNNDNTEMLKAAWEISKEYLDVITREYYKSFSENYENRDSESHKDAGLSILKAEKMIGNLTSAVKAAYSYAVWKNIQDYERDAIFRAIGKLYQLPENKQKLKKAIFDILAGTMKINSKKVPVRQLGMARQQIEWAEKYKKYLNASDDDLKAAINVFLRGLRDEEAEMFKLAWSAHYQSKISEEAYRNELEPIFNSVYMNTKDIKKSITAVVRYILGKRYSDSKFISCEFAFNASIACLFWHKNFYGDIKKRAEAFKAIKQIIDETSVFNDEERNEIREKIVKRIYDNELLVYSRIKKYKEYSEQDKYFLALEHMAKNAKYFEVNNIDKIVEIYLGDMSVPKIYKTKTEAYYKLYKKQNSGKKKNKIEVMNQNRRFSGPFAFLPPVTLVILITAISQEMLIFAMLTVGIGLGVKLAKWLKSRKILYLNKSGFTAVMDIKTKTAKNTEIAKKIMLQKDSLSHKYLFSILTLPFVVDIFVGSASTASIVNGLIILIIFMLGSFTGVFINDELKRKKEREEKAKETNPINIISVSIKQGADNFMDSIVLSAVGNSKKKDELSDVSLIEVCSDLDNVENSLDPENPPEKLIKLMFQNEAGMPVMAFRTGKLGQYICAEAISIKTNVEEKGKIVEKCVQVVVDAYIQPYNDKISNRKCWIFSLSCDKNIPKEILLGRGTLAIVSKISKDKEIRRKLKDPHFNALDFRGSYIFHMHGKIAALANPDALIDEYTEDSVFARSFFVYEAEYSKDSTDNISEAVNINPKYRGIVKSSEGNGTDLNKLGVISSDYVLCDSDIYGDEYRHIMNPRPIFGDDWIGEISRYKNEIYIPGILNKKNSYLPFQENMIILSPSSLPQTGQINFGTGKITDIPEFVGRGRVILRNLLELSRLKIISSFEEKLKKPAYNGPYSPFVGEPYIVNWQVAAKKMGIEDIAPEEFSATQEEINANLVDKIKVKERENKVILKIFEKLVNYSGYLEFMRRFNMGQYKDVKLLKDIRETFAILLAFNDPELCISYIRSTNSKDIQSKEHGEQLIEILTDNYDDFVRIVIETNEYRKYYEQYVQFVREYAKGLSWFGSYITQKVVSLGQTEEAEQYLFKIFQSRDNPENCTGPLMYFALNYMIQWCFNEQMKEALQKVHSAGGKAYFELKFDDINEGTIKAVAHFMDMGFNGIKLVLEKKPATLSETAALEEGLKKLYWEIKSKNPNSDIFLKLPEGSSPVMEYLIKELSKGMISIIPVITYNEIVNGVAKIGGDELLELDYCPENAAARNEIYSVAKNSGAKKIAIMAGMAVDDPEFKITNFESAVEAYFYRLPPDSMNRKEIVENILNRVTPLVFGRPKSGVLLEKIGYKSGIYYSSIPCKNCSVYVEERMAEGAYQEYFLDNGEFVSGKGVIGLFKALHNLKYAGINLASAIRENGNIKTLKLILKSFENTPEFDEYNWKEGWIRLAEYEKNVSIANASNEVKIGYLVEMFGFVRGICERLAESYYRRSVSNIEFEDPYDQKVFRSIMLLKVTLGQKENEQKDIPRFIKNDEYRLMDIIEARRPLELDSDIETFLLEKRKNLYKNDSVTSLLYVKAMMNVREIAKNYPDQLELSREFSDLLSDKNLKEIINPVLAMVNENGGIADLFGEDPEAYEWAVSELYYVFLALAERKIPKEAIEKYEKGLPLNKGAFEDIFKAA